MLIVPVTGTVALGYVMESPPVAVKLVRFEGTVAVLYCRPLMGAAGCDDRDDVATFDGLVAAVAVDVVAVVD
jgi:hypothetical protein